jgi:hypothetical protein
MYFAVLEIFFLDLLVKFSWLRRIRKFHKYIEKRKAEKNLNIKISISMIFDFPASGNI